MVGLETWFGDKADTQKDLASDQDPVVTTAELDEKGKIFQDKVLQLMKRKAPAKPKPVKQDEPAPATQNETTAEPGDDDTPVADDEQPTDASPDDGETAKPARTKDEL